MREMLQPEIKIPNLWHKTVFEFCLYKTLLAMKSRNRKTKKSVSSTNIPGASETNKQI